MPWLTVGVPRGPLPLPCRYEPFRRGVSHSIRSCLFVERHDELPGLLLSLCKNPATRDGDRGIPFAQTVWFSIAAGDSPAGHCSSRLGFGVRFRRAPGPRHCGQSAATASGEAKPNRATTKRFTATSQVYQSSPRRRPDRLSLSLAFQAQSLALAHPCHARFGAANASERPGAYGRALCPTQRDERAWVFRLSDPATRVARRRLFIHLPNPTLAEHRRSVRSAGSVA